MESFIERIRRFATIKIRSKRTNLKKKSITNTRMSEYIILYVKKIEQNFMEQQQQNLVRIIFL